MTDFQFNFNRNKKQVESLRSYKTKQRLQERDFRGTTTTKTKHQVINHNHAIYVTNASKQDIGKPDALHSTQYHNQVKSLPNDKNICILNLSFVRENRT